MPDIVLARPNEKYWIRYIKQRIAKNKNFLGFIGGQTGSGKSWSSLRIAEELDNDFNIDRVVFSGLELMNLINSGKLKRGSVIVFEETGVEMNNRNWGSVINKMLNYLLQTFRHRGFILIMNSPYMDFIDAATRKLFHAELLTAGINLDKQQVRLKPQLIQYNGRLKKFYFKRLRVITPNGVVPVSFWNVARPSKELLVEYERKKREYTDRLNKRILAELEKQCDKGKKKSLTDVQQGVLDLLKQGYTIKQIAEEKSRTVDVIRASMRLIEKKGYVIKPVKDGANVLRYEVTESE